MIKDLVTAALRERMGSRLLLVEDEPALANLLKKYLERLGYKVDACTNANAALALLDTHPEEYALLITDLSLPDMSGDELMTRARLRAPHLPAIIASGYPYEPRVTGVEFLQKPFLPNLLAEAVKRALKA